VAHEENQESSRRRLVTVVVISRMRVCDYRRERHPFRRGGLVSYRATHSSAPVTGSLTGWTDRHRHERNAADEGGPSFGGAYVACVAGR
jgi:Lon protease-like protein